MKTLISIIDELYNTLHIPCVIFDKDLQLIHPKITIIDMKQFLHDVFLMTYHQVHILVYVIVLLMRECKSLMKNKTI